MSKKYQAETNLRDPRPRSERLRKAGASGGGASGSTVVEIASGTSPSGGDGHVHQNKEDLDKISVSGGYVNVLVDQVTEEGSTEKVMKKASAGWADEAGHAEEADHASDADTWKEHEFDDYLDQPVRSTDSPQFAKVTTPRVESPGFSEGFLGSGFRMYIDQRGRAVIEADELTIRKTAKFFELIIQQLKHQGGIVIYSAGAMECTAVEELEDGYKCYFDTKEGQIPNEFVVGDQARCNHFDLATTTAKYYWRLVTAVGTDYIVMSKADCDTGSAAPAVGDNIIQLGNRNDRNRQSAKITTTIDGNSPRDDYYEGINSYDLTGKLITTVGVKDGKVGIWTENGEFHGKVTITGGGGLDNLAEWNDLSSSVSSAWSEALSASQAAGTAQSTANQARAEAATAQLTAEAAADAAAALGTKLSNWASDSVISPLEKEALRQQLADVQKEYSELVSRADRYNVGHAAFTTAYTLASAALAKYTASTPEAITVEADYANIAAYYNARADLLAAISTAEKAGTDAAKQAADNAKSAADAAQQTADDAAAAAAAAQQAADDAQDTADAAGEAAAAANAKLSSWASDSKISPAEKAALKQQKADVVSEHASIAAEATSYGISVTAFYNAYTAAIAAFDKYTAASPEVISVESDYANIAAYYSARATITQAIATAAKQAAVTAKQAADDARAAADAAQVSADAAQGTADRALAKAQVLEAMLDQINDDSVLDLTEKNIIRTQWITINGIEDLSRTSGRGSYAATRALAAMAGLGEEVVITYATREVTYNNESIVYHFTGLAALDIAYLALREYLRSIGLNDRRTVFQGFDRAEFANLLTDYTDAEIRTIEAVNRAYALQLTAFQNAVEENINEMRDVLDGSIDYYFRSGAPTTSNYPAVNWTTEELKRQHLGDVYYDDDDVLAYRWQVDENGNYYWKQTPNDAVAKALSAAALAQDTADGKRRVFLQQPGTGDAYDPGDLWLHATIGNYSDETLVCQVAKAAGTAFSAAHWTTATKYTDDTVANAARDLATTAKAAADAADARAAQAQSTADAASASAAAANTQLSNWASDSKISPVEKASLKQQKADVVAEHTALVAEATSYGISVTAFNAAYTAAIAAFDKYTAASPEVITVESDYANIAAYYTARATLAQDVADATKAAADAAQETADAAAGAANEAAGLAANAKSAADAARAVADAAKTSAERAQSTADSAASAAASANAKLSDWSSDSKISPAEKTALRQQKADVVAEHTALVAEATSYGISVTAFNAAYTAAIAAFDKYTAASPEVITVESDYANIAAYYSSRTLIAQAVANAAKQAADAAQDAADDAAAAAETANEAAAAAQDAADAVAAAIEKIDLDAILDEAEKAEIRNTWTSINGIVSTGSMGLSGTYYAVKVILAEEGRKGFSVEITYNSKPVLYNGEHIFYNHLGESRLDAAYLALREYLNACQINAAGAFSGFDRNHYAELVRDYHVALNGVLQILSDVAKAAAEHAAVLAGDAQTTANNAVSAAASANAKLSSWASDSKISPTEKAALKQQKADVVSEHTAFVQEAGKYSISVTAFDAAYTAAIAAFDKYTAASPEVITVESDYANIAAYYNARAALAQSIATAEKTAIDNAFNAADTANTNIATINQVLARFASDGYVSAQEKLTLKTALQDESVSYVTIVAQAERYSTTAINNAKATLATRFTEFRKVVNYYTAQNTWANDIPVSSSYPLSAITDYYQAREDLVTLINERVKAYAEGYTDEQVRVKVAEAVSDLNAAISAGDTDTYNAAVRKISEFGETIIEGGYVKTNLINTDALIVKWLKTKNNKVVINDDGTITAVDGNFTGVVNATSGSFSGKITASSGSIGGFDIGSNYLGLSNTSTGSPTKSGMSLYNQFICFSDSETGYWAASYRAFIGSNVMPASMGVRGLARFEADGSSGSDNAASGTAIGVYSESKGFRNNYAWYCPDGIFAGFRPAVDISNTSKTLGNLDTVVMCGNSSTVTFTLPSSPKHGQLYALVHSTKNTMNVKSSATHPIMRVTSGGTTTVETVGSTEMETVLLIYNAHATLTYNNATRTGIWVSTYLKI